MFLLLFSDSYSKRHKPFPKPEKILKIFLAEKSTARKFFQENFLHRKSSGFSCERFFGSQRRILGILKSLTISLFDSVNFYEPLSR